MSSRNRNALHAAAAHGTLAQLRELLSSASAMQMLNAQDTKGNTPLMLAAQTSNVEACQVLVAHEATNVNLADLKGRTALHLLAARQPVQVGDLAPYTELLEDILDAGAKHTPDHKGMLPLHTACNAGNYTAVSTLLEHQSDALTARTPLGWRALHFAAKSDTKELVSLLLRRGADPHALCTLAPEPASPQLTVTQVAQHFQSDTALQALNRYLSKNGDKTRSPPARNGAPTNAPASPNPHAPTNQLPKTNAYDQLPNPYDRMPAPAQNDAYDRVAAPSAQKRAAAPLPQGVPVPKLSELGGDYSSVPDELRDQEQIDNEYDSIPDELSTLDPTDNGAYSKLPPPRQQGISKNVIPERYAQVPKPLEPEQPAPALGNEYDNVPNELKALSPNGGPQQPQQYARPQLQNVYSKAPPPAARRGGPRGRGRGRDRGRGGMHASGRGGAVHNRTRAPQPAPAQSQEELAAALVGPRLGRFYRHDWTRQDAERHLKGKKANTFVLRPTTQRDGLITLSFVHPNNGTVQHSLIYKRDEGYTFGEEFGCPPAPNLFQLLQWQKLDL